MGSNAGADHVLAACRIGGRAVVRASGKGGRTGFVRYWRQAEPARRLPNLARLRILIVSGEASYHAPYDHATSAYFAQAGVEHDFIRLAERGIHGNGT